MGIAVIIFTVAIRIILMPLTISGDRSEAERYRLSGEVEELKKKFSADPVARDAHVKNLLKANRKIVFVSGLNLAIQTIVALMLWRIFARGLLGEDLHLLYDFVPQPKEAFNLTFLGKYDLTHPNATFNALQSIVILIFEIVASLFSLVPITRKEMILAQFTLPVGSYIIFPNSRPERNYLLLQLCFLASPIFPFVRLNIGGTDWGGRWTKTEVVADLPRSLFESTIYI